MKKNRPNKFKNLYDNLDLWEKSNKAQRDYLIKCMLYAERNRLKFNYYDDLIYKQLGEAKDEK